MVQTLTFIWNFKWNFFESQNIRLTHFILIWFAVLQWSETKPVASSRQARTPKPRPLLSNPVLLTIHLSWGEKTGMCMSISLALRMFIIQFILRANLKTTSTPAIRNFICTVEILCSHLAMVHAVYLMTKTSLDKNAKIQVIIPISKYVYAAWFLKIKNILLAMTKHLTRPCHIKGLFFPALAACLCMQKPFAFKLFLEQGRVWVIFPQKFYYAWWNPWVVRSGPESNSLRRYRP